MSEEYNGTQRQTMYEGHVYDSQLEAQWAVFFNNVGIAFTPHPGTFRTGKIYAGKEIFYSPDFYLNEYQVFCEVKPSDSFIKDCETQRKLSASIDGGFSPVSQGLMILGGMNNFKKNPEKKLSLKGDFYKWAGAIIKSSWIIGKSNDGEAQTKIFFHEPDWSDEEAVSHYPYLSKNPSATVLRSNDSAYASEIVYKAIFDAIYAKTNGYFVFETDDNEIDEF